MLFHIDTDNLLKSIDMIIEDFNWWFSLIGDEEIRMNVLESNGALKWGELMS